MLAWEWIKEHKWFIEVIAIAGIGNYIYTFHYDNLFTFFITLLSVYTIWHLAIPIIRGFIIHRKASRLSEEQKAEWERNMKFINANRKLRYLNGAPVTIIDKDGVVKVVQSGMTDVIMSTKN